MLPTILFASFISLLISYLTFRLLEAIHSLRDCANNGGGYYQHLTFIEYMAAKYLARNHEISCQRINNNGYNISTYKRTI